MTFTENYLTELPEDLVEKILMMAGALPIEDKNERHLYWKCDRCKTSYTKSGEPRANSKPITHYIRYSPDVFTYLTPNIFLLQKQYFFHREMIYWMFRYYDTNVLLYYRKKN